MPKILIKENEYFYEEADLINFAEGLIGLPKMRRAVLIPMNECAPFCWLASIEDDRNRFIVVDPQKLFSEYRPQIPVELSHTKIKTLAIVNVSSDWRKTTVNLRAPILLNTQTKKGAQLVLIDSPYKLAESLPLN